MKGRQMTNVSAPRSSLPSWNLDCWCLAISCLTHDGDHIPYLIFSITDNYILSNYIAVLESRSEMPVCPLSYFVSGITE
jgi:hypothetical protein